MFLNETKPPLEEALEHHGVKGMHWGRRKNRYSSNEDFSLEPEKKKHTGAKLASGILLVAGAAATYAVLSKNGNMKIPKNVTQDLFKAAKVPKESSGFINLSRDHPDFKMPGTVRTPPHMLLKGLVLKPGFGGASDRTPEYFLKGSSAISSFPNHIWSNSITVAKG